MKTQEPAGRASVCLHFCSDLSADSTLGELFPFTSAPMFRDRLATRRSSCRADERFPSKSLRLHWNYDGNPVGFGAGRTLPARIPFGRCHR